MCPQGQQDRVPRPLLTASLHIPQLPVGGGGSSRPVHCPYDRPELCIAAGHAKSSLGGSWNASRFTVCPSHYRHLRVVNIYDYSRHCKCHLPHVFHLLLSCTPCTLTTRIMAMIENVNQSPSHQRTVALQHEGLPAGLSCCPSSHPTRNAGRRRNAASSTLMAMAISTPTALQVARQIIHTN